MSVNGSGDGRECSRRCYYFHGRHLSLPIAAAYTNSLIFVQGTRIAATMVGIRDVLVRFILTTMNTRLFRGVSIEAADGIGCSYSLAEQSIFGEEHHRAGGEANS